MPVIKRALISVTDKTGVVEFAQGLRDLDVEIVSTGGTARALEAAGVPVREVSELTGFPEMLDGRLKTIHPRVAGGVLAVRANPEHMQSLAAHGIPLIDMVVVNLYQFEKVAARQGVPLSELIANIDIGGPTLIRAAAKNYQDVAVVVSPDDYPAILEEIHEREGELCEPTLWRLAKKAFALTAAYDRAISARLARVGVEDESGLAARSWTFARRARSICAMAKIRTRRPRCIRTGRAGLRAPSSCRARNCRITTWWIWTRPGN